MSGRSDLNCSSDQEDNVIFNVLTKLQSLHDKSTKEDCRRDVLVDGATYLTEFITAVEEHKETTIDRQILLTFVAAFNAFAQALDDIEMNTLFKNDSVFAHEMFHSYIRLFNLTGMKNYLKHPDTKVIHEQLASVILFIVALTVAYSNFTIADLQEPYDNQEVFLSMLNYTKNDFESEPSSGYTRTTQLILHSLWNYADKTVVVPNLIKTGYPEAVLKWLEIANRQDEGSVPSQSSNFLSTMQTSLSTAIRPFISILHNTSRHDDGINALNALGAISIVKKVQSSTKDSEINILCCMILALLSTPEQIKNDRKRMNNALDQLLQSVSNASKSADYKDGGFHISEPLVVLVKLFNDDRALDYILQHAQVELDASSTVEFFVQLLLKYNEMISNEKDPLKQLTCTVLVNILWSISFQEHYQYRRKLKNNSNLIKLLEEFSNNDERIAGSTQYVPKYIENIQTAATGILLNLNEEASTVKLENSSGLTTRRRGSAVDALIPQTIHTPHSTLNNGNKRNQKAMIMISYSHDDKSLCYQLEEELKRNEAFDVWIDKNYCTTGDSWERIADGIKQSQAVLCLITKNYTSKSVRREVIYAIDKLEKPLLPVFVLKPDVPAWLDIRTCDLTHVRFADESKLEGIKMTKLFETLQQLISGSNAGNSSPPIHYEPSITIEQPTNEENLNEPVMNSETIKSSLQKSIVHWNKADVKQWFHENGIIIELYNICQFNDGSELLSFAKVLQDDEKAQYKIYAEVFSKQYSGKLLLLHQFNKFSNALQKLNNEYDKQTSAIKLKSTHAAGKSQTCEIL